MSITHQVLGIDEEGEPRCIWQQLMHQPDVFGPKLRVHLGDAGDIAAGLVEGSNEASLDRIDAGVEHDGHCLFFISTLSG
jgi:hypothetical protein